MRQVQPSPDLLRKLLRYEPETGKLFWLPRGREFFSGDRGFNSWNARNANREAFTALDTHGYKHGSIFKKPKRAHRVIWAMEYNQWPDLWIDHVNGVRSDNRICNLRKATPKDNARNSKISKNNTSGYNGVYFRLDSKKWTAEIIMDGKTKKLGSYLCITPAIIARKVAERGLGFTERHGK